MCMHALGGSGGWTGPRGCNFVRILAGYTPLLKELHTCTQPARFATQRHATPTPACPPHRTPDTQKTLHSVLNPPSLLLLLLLLLLLFLINQQPVSRPMSCVARTSRTCWPSSRSWRASWAPCGSPRSPAEPPTSCRRLRLCASPLHACSPCTARPSATPWRAKSWMMLAKRRARWGLSQAGWEKRGENGGKGNLEACFSPASRPCHTCCQMTHTHTHKHAHTRIQIHTLTSTRAHIHSCTCPHTRKCTHPHKHMHANTRSQQACTHTETRTQTEAHTHIHAFACAHGNIHACACTYTPNQCTHTHARAHTHTLTHLHTQVSARIHPSKCMQTHNHSKRTHTEICTQTKAHTHIHVFAHAHKNIHARAYTCTNQSSVPTHTHTHSINHWIVRPRMSPTLYRHCYPWTCEPRRRVPSGDVWQRSRWVLAKLHTYALLAWDMQTRPYTDETVYAV